MAALQEQPPAGAINVHYEFVDEAEKVLPDKRAEIVVVLHERGVRILEGRG